MDYDIETIVQIQKFGRVTQETVDRIMQNVLPKPDLIGELGKTKKVIEELETKLQVPEHLMNLGKLPIRNEEVGLWNTMINAYAHIGEVDNALECLRKLSGDRCVMSRFTVTGVLPVLTLKGMFGMKENSIIGVHQQSSDHDASFGPDLVTVTTMLPAFSHLAVLRHGKEIHRYMITKGLGNHNSEDRVDDTYINNAGFGNEELDVFRKIWETDVTPHEVTFIGVLSAYFLTSPMEICLIEGYQVCRVPVTIGKSYKVEVLCILDDIDECHILLGGPYRCEVNGRYDVKRNLYLFSWEERRSIMVPPKVIPQSPKHKVKVEEKIVKAEDWSSPKTLSEVRNDKMVDALSRKTTLLVSISNEAMGFDSIKELYASDENFPITWMEFKTKKQQGRWSFRKEMLLCQEGIGKAQNAGVETMFVVVERLLSNPKSQIFVTEDCDDGSRPKEQHLVVPCSDEEIVKFPRQHAITKINGDDGSNLEEFLNVLTTEEADITRPIMAVEDEPLMMLGSGPNIIKEYFSNDLDEQHSTDENKPH
nr:hypothetical protein [Tanacetum cinerariifolium]